MYLLPSLMISLMTLEFSLAFLVKNELGSNATSNQNTHSASDQSIQDLMTLIVEEKRLRFQLEDRLNVVENKLNQVDQFRNEVTKELLKERNNRQQLENMYINVKMELDNVTNILQSERDMCGKLECDAANKDMEKLNMQLYNNSIEMNYFSGELIGLLQDASDKNMKIANNSFELTTMKDQFNALSQLFSNINRGNISVGTEKQFVGFSVKGVSSQSTVSSDNPLRFHSTTFNDVFNITAGVFVCSQPGLYFFTFSFIHNHQGSYSFCCIYKNDRRSPLSCAINGDTTSAAFSTATTSGILSLKAGDRVYVGECTHPSSLDGNTNLTGFLLKPN